MNNTNNTNTNNTNTNNTNTNNTNTNNTNTNNTNTDNTNTETANTENTKRLLAQLNNNPSAVDSTAELTPWLNQLSSDQWCDLLRAIISQPLPHEPSLERVARCIAAWHRGNSAPELAQPIRRLCEQLAPERPSRALLLQCLARNRHGWTELAEVLTTQPPTRAEDLAVALSPLFQTEFTEEMRRALFPRILEAVKHQQVAAPILDLANYAAKQAPELPHPAQSRAAEWTRLLGELTQRLTMIEENPAKLLTAGAAGVESLEQIRALIDWSAPLAVALCHALALMGDDACESKLLQALELKHRRIRTEAAWALARLGKDAGRTALCQLCAEPVARLRALEYAEELGFADQVDPQWRTEEALAAAELSVWLAEPSQFGVPPHSLNLIDQRRLVWPGSDEPQDCFLFEFTYPLGEAAYSNWGLAGPLSFAFAGDLKPLDIEDAYAAFAGWHADHQEIQEFEVEQLSDAGRREVARLARRLSDAGCRSVQPRLFGIFFGQQVVVAAAVRDEQPGLAIADQDGTLFLPSGDAPNPLRPTDAFCVYKGRKILRAFNE